MMHKKLAILFMIALPLTAVSVRAVQGEGPKVGEDLFIARVPGPGIGGGATAMGVGFAMDLKVVTGAPYSADAVTEMVQTLADGNKLTRHSRSRIARDSQGRVRQELSFEPPRAGQSKAPVTMISISDPPAGVTYTLHPEIKTADRIPLPPIHPGMTVLTEDIVGGRAGNVIYQKGVIVGGDPAGTMPPPLPPTPQIARFQVFAGGASGSVAAVPHLNDASSTEDLGTQSINGLAATGKRTTTTIPAGEIGNERPIVIINESWYSPDLQTVIFSKRDDPMAGTTTYRLTNISQVEPDPALFQVPADYTINDAEAVTRKLQKSSIPAKK